LEERKKDRLEDFGSATLEAVVSAIPVIGGPLSVFTNRALGSAFERRQTKIVAELRGDLMRLENSGLVRFDAALAESDAFQAAVTRTFRQLLESDSDAKRKLLRNALLNRVIGLTDASRYERALEACEADDIRVLAAADEITDVGDHVQARVTLMNHLEKHFEDHNEPVPSGMYDRTRILVGLGLIDETQKSDLKERQPGYLRADQREPENFVSNRRLQSVSSLGRGFLDFIRDPLESTFESNERG
jgi:hypothetical protein